MIIRINDSENNANNVYGLSVGTEVHTEPIVGDSFENFNIVIPNGAVLIGNTEVHGFDVGQLSNGAGIIIQNAPGSITISATGGAASDQFARDTANGAFAKANGAAQNAFVTLNVAGQSDIVADSNTDTLTIVGSGITITTNTGTDTLTIQHPASGVTASGYANAATIPVFVVNANGHVTSVTNTSVAIAASQVVSGVLVVSRGGTGRGAINGDGSLLIGNTLSGVYDVNPLTAGRGITITNTPGNITVKFAPNTILQVQTVQTRTMTTYSAPTSGNGTQITPLDLTVTPQQAGNKMILEWHVNGECHQDAVFLVQRNGVVLADATDVLNNKWAGISTVPHDATVNTTPNSMVIRIIDTNTLGVSTIYSLHIRASDTTARTLFFNRTSSGNGANASETSLSSGVAMEIAQ